MPGMTGQWQIRGPMRVPLREMVAIDYLYVANWSLWTDIKILLRTVAHVCGRRGPVGRVTAASMGRRRWRIRGPPVNGRRRGRLGAADARGRRRRRAAGRSRRRWPRSRRNR